MKSKTLIALGVSALFVTTGAFAFQEGPSAADETSPAMTTIQSLDNQTGGYKGWGPMPNPHVAASVDESYPLAHVEKDQAYKQHLAEVRSQRDQVWVANAPLRSEYENIGATRSEGGGFGRFFSR